MIAALRGSVQTIALDHLVLDVGGVGYAVRATPATLGALTAGETVTLATTLVVREDSMTLYGFADRPAKELFELVQSVSGVGPKIALALLAVFDPDELSAALAAGDTAMLTRAPGIGKKGAERLVLELKDKVVAVTEPEPLSVSDPGLTATDTDIEASLRPKDLTEFVGQQRVRQQLELVLAGAKLRGTVPDHVLLSGPPGLGKTSLAMIIAAELGSTLRVTSGPALERAGDLAAMLSNLSDGDVLFIDEIHRIARPAEELLYLAMEDFRVDVVVGKGPGATSIPLELAPFTLVGATTRAGQLTSPLRDRFGFTGHLEFYAPDELATVLRRAAGILNVELRADGAAEIAGRSRGTPRIANRLLRRVRDFAQVQAGDAAAAVDRAVARQALTVYDVDELGLDRLDRAVLTALCRSFGGGPVGLKTLAVAVGEEPATVEEVCEPYLVRIGMLARTASGRVATPAAWQHLGLAGPAAPGADPGLFGD
ncbi:Holliday junction branch migration DNA helicase RuvB [Nakamurella sp. DB0629]|uniref:Multifunctional fusion protein n=1 Tax=Nakamurella aerolata TaxID=1656892 RepID=A0A849A132_9ACTN|nr:Holliday junction branch migration DNA helicase RuvB [Nakamurella aerolata]NNG34744.1 Holliday junction branch migration DNA helicase RuvB [Nakamurella aerolata]